MLDAEWEENLKILTCDHFTFRGTTVKWYYYKWESGSPQTLSEISKIVLYLNSHHQAVDIYCKPVYTRTYTKLKILLIVTKLKSVYFLTNPNKPNKSPNSRDCSVQSNKYLHNCHASTGMQTDLLQQKMHCDPYDAVVVAAVLAMYLPIIHAQSSKVDDCLELWWN